MSVALVGLLVILQVSRLDAVEVAMHHLEFPRGSMNR